MKTISYIMLFFIVVFIWGGQLYIIPKNDDLKEHTMCNALSYNSLSNLENEVQNCVWLKNVFY